MLPSRLLSQIWSTHGKVLNGYITIASPLSSEVYARQGWDTVTMDMEHGSIGFDTAVAILQAISAVDVIPMVRIPKCDLSIVGQLLDAGVLGITGAMINTRKEAQALVSACFYGPQGSRGLSRQCRASMIYGPNYELVANERVSVFAMIESPEGMANLDEIASVEGLSGIYFGGVDYGMSLLQKEGPTALDDPLVTAQVAQAQDKVVAACKRNHIIAGMFARNTQAAEALVRGGFGFLTLSSDARAMAENAQAFIKSMR